MARSLEVLLGRRHASTAAEFLAVVDEAIAPNERYRCMNPECDGEGMCEWTPGAGRPRRFCSRRCLQIFDRVQSQLVREIMLIDEWMQRPDVTWSMRVALASHLARRRWALERYPLSQKMQSRLFFGVQDDDSIEPAWHPKPKV